MTDSGGIKGRAWQALRLRVIAEEDTCHLCHRPVDKTLSGRDPFGPTVDHRIPRSQGGPLLDRSNLALAHLRCNAAKKNRLPRTRRNSRRWVA